MGWSSCETKLCYKYRKRTHTITSAIEESYQRDEIPCGFACGSCPPAQSTQLALDAPCILMPDEECLDAFLEVFEIPDVSNYVLCRSVVKKFAQTSNLRKSVRVRSLFRDRRRQCYLFDDLHCQWINRDGQPALLAAAEYYWQHLGGRIPVVVVSDALAGVHSRDELMQVMQRLNLADGASDSASSAWPSSSHGSSSTLTASTALSQPHPEAQSHEQSRALRERLLQQGVNIMSAAECFSQLYTRSPAVIELLDSLLQARLAKAEAGAGAGAAGGRTGQQDIYPAHWSQVAIEEGLGEGQVLQGVLHISQRNPCEAVVQVGGGSDMVLGRLVRVSGREAINRALQGDRVAVRLVRQAEVKQMHETNGVTAGGTADAAARPTDVAAEAGATDGTDPGAEMLLDEHGAEAGGEEEAGATAVLAGGEAQLAALPQGVVVGILLRASQGLVACLAQGDEEALSKRASGTASNRQEAVLAVPFDRRMPFVRIRTRLAHHLLGQRFVVRVDGWPKHSKYPEGHVAKVLGPINDLRAESQAVLEQTGIVWQPFCDGALAELPQLPNNDATLWQVPDTERAKRRDLTGPEYFVCSIDPVGCTDVDDALHVRLLSDGKVEVGVHIADVSWFVRPGSMLDSEARDRCTSVYLVDRRLDMLPSLLSEQLCSLRSNCERYAVSVIWTLKDARSFEVEDIWYGRTIIRSRYQLHYQQAQDVLDGRPPAPGDELPAGDRTTLLSGLQVMAGLTDKLHAARVADGALELASTELRFKTDALGKPVAVASKPKVPMMDIVAEMMIWANAAVAFRIATAFPGAALLRNHPPPRQEAFEAVRGLLEQDGARVGSASSASVATATDGGAGVELGSNKSLSTALAAACRRVITRDAAAAHLLKSLTTRVMSEAKYFSTGAAAPGTQGAYHYGLALKYYTHFTSPIRRYADVVVHRQLLAALAVDPTQPGGAQAPIPHAELSTAAARMNEQHRLSKHAQKKCQEMYLLLMLASHPHVESALVMEVQDGKGLEVWVPRYALRGRVQVVDSRGLVRLPLTGDLAQEASEADAFAQAARRAYAFRTMLDGQAADIMDTRTGHVLWSAATWQATDPAATAHPVRIWVHLGADGSRAHGPKLNMRLVADTHPSVVAAKAEAQQEAPKSATSSQPGPTPLVYQATAVPLVQQAGPAPLVMQVVRQPVQPDPVPLVSGALYKVPASGQLAAGRESMPPIQLAVQQRDLVSGLIMPPVLAALGVTRATVAGPAVGPVAPLPSFPATQQHQAVTAGATKASSSTLAQGAGADAQQVEDVWAVEPAALNRPAQLVESWLPAAIVPAQGAQGHRKRSHEEVQLEEQLRRVCARAAHYKAKLASGTPRHVQSQIRWLQKVKALARRAGVLQGMMLQEAGRG